MSRLKEIKAALKILRCAVFGHRWDGPKEKFLSINDVISPDNYLYYECFRCDKIKRERRKNSFYPDPIIYYVKLKLIDYDKEMKKTIATMEKILKGET